MDGNEETLLDGQLTFLLDLFPDVDSGILLEAAIHSEGSREQAIDYVLAHQVACDSEGEKDQFPSCEDELSRELASTVQELHNCYPELDRPALCSFVLAYEGESVEALRELLGAVLRRQQKQRKRKESVIPIDEACFQVGRRADATSPSIAGPSRRTMEGLKDAIIKMFEEDIDDIDDEDEGPTADTRELREQASALHVERVGMLKKASAAYSANKGGPIAQYYSMEAAGMGRRIQELHKLAAYYTFVRLNRDLPSHTIDLHGLTVPQGLLVVDLVIEYLRALDSNPSSGIHLSRLPGPMF